MEGNRNTVRKCHHTCTYMYTNIEAIRYKWSEGTAGGRRNTSELFPFAHAQLV